MTYNYVAPSYHANAFHCPHCQTYAHQVWRDSITAGNIFLKYKDVDFEVSRCQRCYESALWLSKKMIFPVESVAPFPAENTPKDVEEDFLEARKVINVSPRAAAALVRLALQKLMLNLGEKGRDLNEDIGNLVRRGLPLKVQKALDSVRVIGNNAVHPGHIDLKDDLKTAVALFELLNMIVEAMITQEKKIDAIYERIPDSIKEQIVKRDHEGQD